MRRKNRPSQDRSSHRVKMNTFFNKIPPTRMPANHPSTPSAANLHSKKLLSWELTPLLPSNSKSSILVDATPTDITQSISGSECSDGTQQESYLAELLAETQYSATQPQKFVQKSPPSSSPNSIAYPEPLERSLCYQDVHLDASNEPSITPGPETPKAHNHTADGDGTYHAHHQKASSNPTSFQVTKSVLVQKTPLLQPKFSPSEYVQAIKVENFSPALEGSIYSIPLQSTYPAHREILPCPPDVSLNLSTDIPDQSVTRIQDSPSLIPLQCTNPANKDIILPCPPDLSLNLSTDISDQSVTRIQDSPSLVPLQCTNPGNKDVILPCPPDLSLNFSPDIPDQSVTRTEDSPSLVPLQSTNPANKDIILPCPPDVTLDLSREDITPLIMSLQASPTSFHFTQRNAVPPSDSATFFNPGWDSGPNPWAVNRSKDEASLSLCAQSSKVTLPTHDPHQGQSNHPTETIPRDEGTTGCCDPEPQPNSIISPAPHHLLSVAIEAESTQRKVPEDHLELHGAVDRSIFPCVNVAVHSQEPSQTDRLTENAADALAANSTVDSAYPANNSASAVDILSVTDPSSYAKSSLQQPSILPPNPNSEVIQSMELQIGTEDQPTKSKMSKSPLASSLSLDSSLLPSPIHSSRQLQDDSLGGDTEPYDIAHFTFVESCSPTNRQLSELTPPEIPSVICNRIASAPVNIKPLPSNHRSLSIPTSSKSTLDSSAQVISPRIDASLQRCASVPQLPTPIDIERSTSITSGKRKRSLNVSDLQPSSTRPPIVQDNQIHNGSPVNVGSCDEHSLLLPDSVVLSQEPTPLPPQDTPAGSSNHPSIPDQSTTRVQRAYIEGSSTRVSIVIPRSMSQRKKLPLAPLAPPAPSIKSTSRVKVVVPRGIEQRKSAPRVPSSLASRPPSLRALHDSDSTTHSLPIHRVLAYRQDCEAFLPGEVCSIAPDQIIVNFYDGNSQPRDLKHLRLCHICVGDVVQYIGSDLADEESQFTSIRHPKRVLKVEKDAEMIDLSANSRRDVLVCCEERDYNPRSRSADPVSKSDRYSRFLLEAIMVIPHESRKYTGLKDRVLPQQMIDELGKLMRAHSGVGMRKKLAATSSMYPNKITSNSVSSDQIFQGFGILLTAAGQTSHDSQSSTRKRNTTRRQTIEQQIRDRKGTLIHQISDLYELTGSDMSLDESSPQGIANNQRVAISQDNSPSYWFIPSSKHQRLRTILLVAETPLKTFKYLMALALGIVCVSTKWITDSCENGHVLDWEKYMIGPGPSTFLGGVQSLINIQLPLINRVNHDLISIFDFHPSIQIFKNKSFIYLSSKPKNKSDWMETVRPILCASGAAKISYTETKSLTSKTTQNGIGFLKRFDYILLEDHLSLELIPPSIKNQSNLNLINCNAKRKKLTRTASSHSCSGQPNRLDQFDVIGFRVVDFEWLKQSLIYGHVLKPQLFATS